MSFPLELGGSSSTCSLSMGAGEVCPLRTGVCAGVSVTDAAALCRLISLTLVFLLCLMGHVTYVYTAGE